jgi:hypothetical protein
MAAGASYACCVPRRSGGQLRLLTAEEVRSLPTVTVTSALTSSLAANARVGIDGSDGGSGSGGGGLGGLVCTICLEDFDTGGAADTQSVAARNDSSSLKQLPCYHGTVFIIFFAFIIFF